MRKIIGVLLCVFGAAIIPLLSPNASDGGSCGVAGGTCNTGNVVVGNAYNGNIVHHEVREVFTPVTFGVPFIPVFSFQWQPPTPCVQQQQQMPAQQVQEPANKKEDLKALIRSVIAEMNQQNPEDSDEEDDSLPVAFDNSPPARVGQTIQAHSKAEQLLALRNSCVQCHAGAKAKGAIKIFDDKGDIEPLAPKGKILDAIEKGRMPLASAKYKMTALDKLLIREWAVNK